jgi:23S rRNA (pseudouridine1915-N3)-methyltransferase
MRIALICVGRLKSGPARELFERYLKRLSENVRAAGIAGIDLREFGESRARRPDDRRAEEGAAIIAAIPGGAAPVVLDARGVSLTSEGWAADIARARDASHSTYPVVIGGPDGLEPTFRASARLVVSFGAMTWPHQLVRVMATEQLYRAVSILSGHPYHRADRRDVG